eukprot:1148355-Pelagomonas_calceolata.AAC.10
MTCSNRGFQGFVNADKASYTRPHGEDHHKKHHEGDLFKASWPSPLGRNRLSSVNLPVSACAGRLTQGLMADTTREGRGAGKPSSSCRAASRATCWGS